MGGKFKTLRIRLVPLAVVAAAVALLLSWASPVPEVQAQQPNEMAVDAIEGGSLDASVTVQVGQEFMISLVTTYVDATTPIAGYAYNLDYDETKISWVSETLIMPDVDGDTVIDMTTCATPSPPTGLGDMYGGCLGAKTGPYVGPLTKITLKCDDAIAAGTIELLDSGQNGLFFASTQGLGGATINTNLTDATVTCQYQADLELTKDAPATVIAGDTLTYTLTVHNIGPHTSYAVLVGDDLPDDKVFIEAQVDGLGPDSCQPGWLPSYPSDDDNDGVADEDPIDGVDNDGDCAADDSNGNGTPCDCLVVGNPFTCDDGVDEDPPNSNIVMCYCDPLSSPLFDLEPSETCVVEIMVGVPEESAGKLELNLASVQSLDLQTLTEVTPDPNPSNNIAYALTQVLPADISITKVADKDPAVYSEGEQITWTVTATSNGPSPASSVVLTDTVGANQAIVSASADVTCTEAGGVPEVVGQDVTCTLASSLAASSAATLTIVTDVISSVDNTCVNDAAVEWADPLTDDVHAEVVCLPPTVRMEKDLDEDSVTIIDTTNLFLEMVDTDSDTVVDSLACLTVYELVTNAGNDPDGVGAYEFQLKFDHKIFDITIEDSSWLSNSDDGWMWTRAVDCTMTIISENDIRFGCVSSGPVPGQTDDGVAAIITVCPEPDLVNRLTPGQENGLFEILLDENCELADVLGDPLRIPIGSLAPGVLPGGILEVCSDMSITVRILEADLNLDCVVDVLDEQAIAFRYGAFFGNLLYDPWYDLQPALKDFDIDIKDLQKVFGRDGSTCLEPIPPQDPLPAPPWPTP